MTWLSLIATLCRFMGLIQLADKFYVAHEAKVKAQEVKNAESNIIRMPDNAVDKQLRDKFSRD